MSIGLSINSGYGGDMGVRCFPMPWQVMEHAESFCVADATGYPLAYIYFEEVELRRNVMGRMTRDEARRIAGGIARLPEYLAKPT